MGVLAVEMFVLDDGAVLANEIAPRVHNSGHWTEALCSIDQFELHIRAITGAPLPKVAANAVGMPPMPVLISIPASARVLCKSPLDWVSR